MVSIGPVRIFMYKIKIPSKHNEYNHGYCVFSLFFHKNKHAYKGYLNKHAYKGYLNKHAYKGYLNKHAYKGYLTKHAYKGYLNKHAYKGYLNKHAYKGYLNKHAYKGYLNKHAYKGYLNKHAYKGYLNKHAYKGYLTKHAYKGYLNKHAYKGYLTKYAYKGYLNKHAYKGYLTKHAYKGYLNKHAYKGYLTKHAYKGYLLQKMNWSRKDSKTFWKLLDKLEHNQDNTIFTNNISEERWKIHFKNNFNTLSERYPLPQKTAEQGPLDFPICEEEIQLAIYILRNGKSPGYDSISNEILLCLYNVKPEIIKLLFNSILQNPMIINKWSISVISPLHKKGSKLDPDNHSFGTISLLSCFGKF